MRTFGRSVFLHCSKAASVTSRTAVYGPVRTVVWQGSAGDRRPYADQVGKCGLDSIHLYADLSQRLLTATPAVPVDDIRLSCGGRFSCTEQRRNLPIWNRRADWSKREWRIR